LQRELEEELGIYVDQAEPWVTVHHDYPHRRITLNVLRVLSYAGVPEGREGQALQWLRPPDLHEVDFLEANRRIVRSLQLPSQYLITDAQRFGRERVLSRLDTLLGRGGLIQVREKSMPHAELREFVGEVVSKSRGCGAKVLLNASVNTVIDLGVDGIHLTSSRLRACDQRPLSDRYWVAASCHNEDELEMATRINADFVVLGPVSRTVSHPGTVPLGWRRFGALCAKADMPVYALGGMRPEDLPQAQRVGAQGIAMIGALWGGSPDD
jgi:8-oxo-dGTP diphosphatase